MSCSQYKNIEIATVDILSKEDFIIKDKNTGFLSVKQDSTSKNKFVEWQQLWKSMIQSTYPSLENVTSLWNYNSESLDTIQINEDLAKRIDEERSRLEKGGLLQGTKTGDIRGIKYTSYNGFPFSNDRLKKLDKGDKTATVRPKNHPTGVYKFNNQEYLIENKGYLAFNELENSDEFLNNWIGGIDKLQRNVPEYKHIENWVDGEGKQYVYSIKKLTTEEASLYKEQKIVEEPIISESVKKTNERIQVVKDLLIGKIAGLESRLKSNTGNKEIQEKYKVYLESLISQLEGEQASSGVMKFLQTIDKEVLARLAHLEKLESEGKQLPAHEIAYMRMFLNISSVIKEFQTELNTNKETTLFPSKARVEVLLRNISHRLQKITDKVVVDNKTAVAESLMEANNSNSGLTVDKIKNLLGKGFGDVSWLTSVLGVARDSVDPILALAAQKIQEFKFYGRIKADKENKSLAELTNKLKDYKKSQGISTSNHAKLYENFIEKDSKGKPTGYLIRRTLEEEFYVNNPNATKAEKIAFYRANGIDKRNVNYTAPLSNAYKKLSKEEKEWYDGVIAMRSKAISNFGSKISIYKIPTLSKSDVDIIQENGLFSTEYFESVKHKFKPSKLDYEYSQAQDLSGNPVNTLPIYFNSPLDADTLSQLSFNLTNSFMAFNSMAYTYGELNKIVDTIENTRDLLANRDVVVTTGGIANVNKFVKGLRKRINPDTHVEEDPVEIIKGSKTNSFKQFEKYLDEVFYNKPSEKAMILGKDVTKTIDTINKYTAFSKLTFNVLQAGSQVITGSLWRKVEAFGKNEYDHESLNSAVAEYNLDTIHLLKDSINNIPSTKINALRKYLGVGRQDNHFKSDMEKLLNPAHTSILNHTGDHMMSSVTMMAMMKFQKVKTSNGEEISLWDAFDLDKNNNLTLKKGIEFTDKDAFKLAQKISTINRQIDGVITQDDQNAAKRNPWARSILFMRNWVHPSFAKRFSYDYDENGNLKGEFNQSLGREQIGYYTDTVLSTIDFYKNVLSEWDSKRLAAISTAWKNLDIEQRKNIAKTGFELAMIATTFALAKALTMANYDDDDEKNIVLSTMSVMLFRVNNEMAQYLRPDLTLDMLKSPAVSISLLESATQLGWNVIGFRIDTPDALIDWNINNVNEKTDELNLLKPIKKNIPFWHTVDQFQNMNTHKSLD